MAPKEGLFYEAERHKIRVNYFLNNCGLFKHHFKHLRDLHDYEVRGYLVTKHTPLISQYKDIGILSLADLVEYELKPKG